MLRNLSLRNFLSPTLALDRVDVCTLILIAIGVHFAVAAEECPLVEGVLVWHVAGLRDLVQLGVEQVRRGGRGSVLLASEDQDFTL